MNSTFPPSSDDPKPRRHRCHYTPGTPLLVLVLSLTVFGPRGGAVLALAAAIADAQPRSANAELSEARAFIAAAAADVDKIADESDRERLLYDLAGMQAMTGDVEKAKAAAFACSVGGRRSEIYRYIGELQAALGDKQGARETLLLSRKAALAARSKGDKEGSWLSLGLLAIEHARIGDFKGAFETLQFIEDPKSREEYRTSIALFQKEPEARKTISRVKAPFERDLAVKGIVDTNLWSGNKAAAWASAKEIANPGLRCSAYVAIAEFEGKTADAKRAYAEAKASAEEIRRAHATSNALTIPEAGDSEFHEIAASQARMGDIEGAKATAASVKDRAEKAASLVDIARAQLKSSDRQGARATLAEAINVRTTAASDYYDFTRQLAAALAEAGDLPEALKTVALMDDRGESKDHAYEEVIIVLLGEHKLKQAREIVARIADPRWKASALARTAAAEASTGDTATARKTFAEARAITATVPAKNAESWTCDRSHIYHYVAMSQSETGDFDEIRRWIPSVTSPRDRVSAWLGAAFPLAHRYHDSRKKPGEETGK